MTAAAAAIAASAGPRQTYGRRQCAWVPDTLDLDAAGAAEVRAPIASLPAKTHWPITVRAWRCSSQSWKIAPLVLANGGLPVIT